MRIAYIVPSLAKQGPVLVVYELVVQMLGRGHAVVVFYFDQRAENVVEFPCRTERISFWQRIDFNRFDVIHSHASRPDMYVALHRRRKDPCRFVSTVHSFSFSDLRMQYNLLTAIVAHPVKMMALRRMDIRVVLSRQAVHYYRHWFRGRRTVCVYNTRSVDTSRVLSTEERQEIEKFKGNDLLLGVNAMLSPVKAIDVIIKAMSLVESVKLFVAGDGKSRAELEQLAREKGVGERVLFAGYREDAYRYIPFYDIYMMPSRSEGFPLALLEAMSQGCNAVVSDIPIFKEFFSDREVTFFHLDDVQDCARAIDYAGTHNKGQAAQTRYLRDYAPDVFGMRYEEVYTMPL